MIRRVLKGLALGVAGLVALVLVAVVGLVGWSAFSVPDANGQARLSGIAGPVEILRDRHGVAYVTATSEADAYFGLGFAHAQDRLVQMEVSRRIGRGRLAEVVGARALPTDRFMRTLGLARVAEAEVAAATPEVRAALDAYAAGVNAYIARHDGPWPPEFTLLMIRPEPWQASDSVLLGKLLALMLTGNWWQEGYRARLVARLGPDLTEQLLPATLGDGKPTIHAGADAPGARSALARAFAAAPPFLDARGASNIWAIAGSRTATGSPILANDPHLGLQAPSLWYLARLSAPGFAVTGATIPGIPMPLLGHNGRVAWGMTTTNGDGADLVLERIDPANPDRYLTPDGPVPFDHRTEVIEVRFGAPVTVDVRTTRHGPVISDGEVGPRVPRADDLAVALAHVALRPGDRTVQAMRDMTRAPDAEAFRDALRNFHAPMQNIAFADRAGTIGLVAAGRLPIRRGGDGRLPVAGWDGSADWLGWIAFDDLPQAMNPPSGALWNANNSVVGPKWPAFIGADFDVPYRAGRIETLLDATARHDLDTSAAMQADVLSPMARDMLPGLIARLPALTGQAAAARDRLAAWDGAMRGDAAEPLIFSAWMRALVQRLFATELGPEFDAFWGNRPRALANALDGNPRWCRAAGPQPPAAGDPCAPVLAAALDDALADLATRFGADPGAWRWDTAHPALLRHQLLGRVPVVGGFVSRSVPTAGGEDTLLRGDMRYADADQPFANIHAASFRGLYDLSDLDRSRFVISTGQSGNPWSSAYADFIPLWQADRTVTIPTEPDHASARGVWRLVPATSGP